MDRSSFLWALVAGIVVRQAANVKSAILIFFLHSCCVTIRNYTVSEHCFLLMLLSF